MATVSKTHVYINEEFAKQIEAADGDKLLQEKVIADILQRKQKEVTYEMEILNEQVLEFKLASSKFERAMSEAYDQQEVKIQALIDNVCDQHSKVNDAARKLASQINPVRQEIDSMLKALESFDQRLTSINQYRINDFLAIVERIAALSEQDKVLMLKLMGCNNE